MVARRSRPLRRTARTRVRVCSLAVEFASAFANPLSFRASDCSASNCMTSWQDGADGPSFCVHAPPFVCGRSRVS